MRIFSKKSFAFHDPNGQERPVEVRSQSFADVPDWVTKSTMYKLADKDGDIMVINTKADEINAELKSPDRSKREKARQEKAKEKAEAEPAAVSEQEQK